QVILQADPSAVTGFSESDPDLVNLAGGSSSYLSQTSGLITTYQYATTTTATTTSAGDVAGWLQQAAIQQGQTGTSVLQSSATYIETPVGGVFLPAAATQYRNTNGTGGETTATSYTFQGSTAAVASATVTNPTVTTGENGSGTATSTTTVFDSY